MASTDAALDAPHTPIPAASELLTRFSDAEPNRPDRPGGTLSDLLDELGDAFIAYGQAFAAAASTLRHHQPGLPVEAADLDAAASGLMQGGWACRQLGPSLRGFLPALPWLDPDAPIPPADDDDGAEAKVDADTQPPGENTPASGDPA